MATDNIHKLNEMVFRKHIDNIINNNELLEFIIKILNYSHIFNDDSIRYLFLGSLISSDTIVDMESSDKSLNDLLFIKTNIDLFDINDDIRQEVLKHVDNGIDIINNDKKQFINKTF